MAEFEDTEIWVIVNESPAYMVSNHGRVRRDGRILRPWLIKGYPAVALSNKSQKIVAKRLVHRLVAIAFIGPAPSAAHEVAHNDGNPANAYHSNLRWATHAENLSDMVRHGTHNRGERFYRPKLSDLAVRDIKTSREPQSVLAQRYGVHQTTISNVKTGKRWAHVPS